MLFTGHLRGPELAAAYASADLFTFPSASEAFGNVVLEAMASALPVVAAAAGGGLDLVEPDLTGQLFRTGDSVELVACVRKYLKAPELLVRHGAAALAAARRRTWRRQQELLMRHYRSQLGSHHPRAA